MLAGPWRQTASTSSSPTPNGGASPAGQRVGIMPRRCPTASGTPLTRTPNVSRLTSYGRWWMPERYVPYGRQLIEDDDIAAVTAALRSDYLTTGPLVGEFENALADVAGASHAVAFNSGTAALHAAYHALGIGPGDEG